MQFLIAFFFFLRNLWEHHHQHLRPGQRQHFVYWHLLPVYFCQLEQFKTPNSCACGKDKRVKPVYACAFLENTPFFLESGDSCAWSLFTFIFCFLGCLKVSPLCPHQSAELPERVVWVLGFNHSSHFTAEQNVATHVDFPFRTFLLCTAFGRLWGRL